MLGDLPSFSRPSLPSLLPPSSAAAYGQAPPRPRMQPVPPAPAALATVTLTGGPGEFTRIISGSALARFARTGCCAVPPVAAAPGSRPGGSRRCSFRRRPHFPRRPLRSPDAANAALRSRPPPAMPHFQPAAFPVSPASCATCTGSSAGQAAAVPAAHLDSEYLRAAGDRADPVFRPAAQIARLIGIGEQLLWIGEKNDQFHLGIRDLCRNVDAEIARAHNASHTGPSSPD